MNMDMVNNFVQYVLEFYGDKGIYDLGFKPNKEDVLIALALRLDRYQQVEFAGDSTDREFVRDIMLDMRNKQPWEIV